MRRVVGQQPQRAQVHAAAHSGIGRGAQQVIGQARRPIQDGGRIGRPIRVPVRQPHQHRRVEPGGQGPCPRLRIDLRIDIEHRVVTGQPVAQGPRQLALARAQKHSHAETFAA